MPVLLPDPLVRVTAGPDGGAVRVRWSLPPDAPAGALAQVYVDGQLAAVSASPADRELLVPIDLRADWPAANVQLVLVGPTDGNGDFRDLVRATSAGGRAVLRWPRTNDAPLDATVNVFGNGGSGPINFASSLNARPIAWFPGGAGKWGFGLSGFGGDFGYDGASAVGFGFGGLGVGEFGFDAAWAEWTSDPLGPGEHRLVVVGRDGLGNSAAPSAQATVTILPPPPMIAQIALSGSATTLALSVTNSAVNGQ